MIGRRACECEWAREKLRSSLVLSSQSVTRLMRREKLPGGRGTGRTKRITKDRKYYRGDLCGGTRARLWSLSLLLLLLLLFSFLSVSLTLSFTFLVRVTCTFTPCTRSSFPHSWDARATLDNDFRAKRLSFKWIHYGEGGNFLLNIRFPTRRSRSLSLSHSLSLCLSKMGFLNKSSADFLRWFARLVGRLVTKFSVGLVGRLFHISSCEGFVFTFYNDLLNF